MTRPFPSPRVIYAPEGDGIRGRQAAGLAALGGVELDGAQRLVLDAGCDRRGGRWSAPTCVVIVARQNLKSVCLRVRELTGLLLWGERLSIHSAHQWRTTALQFRETVDMITGSPLRRYLPQRGGIRRASGEEAIVFKNGACLSGRRRKFVWGGPGLWAWFVAGRGEVDGAGGVEGLLRCAGMQTGAQDGVLVAVAGGGVDREAEGVSGAAVVSVLGSSIILSLGEPDCSVSCAVFLTGGYRDGT